MWSVNHFDFTVWGSPSKAVGCAREQYDRLVEGSRLVHSRLRAQLPSIYSARAILTALYTYISRHHLTHRPSHSGTTNRILRPPGVPHISLRLFTLGNRLSHPKHRESKFSSLTPIKISHGLDTREAPLPTLSHKSYQIKYQKYFTS